MELKKVDIFSPYSNVNGWFTKKNSGGSQSGDTVSGLDCGSNTATAEEVVTQNRKKVCDAAGLELSGVAFAGQVHGVRIEIVNRGGTYPETDALITQKYGITLAIQVADCAAVLIADPESNIIAAVHAGWRGAVADIIPKTITDMQRLANARPDRMLVYISPCISQIYFEVGTEVALQFPDRFVDYDSFEKPHANLKGFIYHQLRKAGIPEKQIESDSGCTYRNSHEYFSYRRERDKAGRMLALIQLK